MNSAKPTWKERRKVVLVIFDRSKMLDVTGPLQVFNDARLEDGNPAYEVILASETGGPVTTDTGVTLDSERIDDVMAGPIDTLLITGGAPAQSTAATASLRSCLAKYLDHPRRIGSICVGAFILAELGVLDGREATTHWEKCRNLQRDYPSVIVRPDSIFVLSDGIWTSAGVSAGIDMALAMVEDDLGHVTALALARRLVLFLKRPGGQSQFSVELRRQMHDARGRFDDLHTWMRANIGSDLSVAALAAEARMSPRNFARVYHRDTGESPARAVEQFRVEAARRLLEAASDSIQRIAHRVGFGDDERMRRAFLTAYGVSPQDYRSRFGQA
ncbi:GlxA family transcriptional regulator [Rhizobium brockwellii]